MKIDIKIDCSPAEARAFFGLPDLQPMQESLLREVETRMKSALKAMDGEALMKAWMPAGIGSLGDLQKMFWDQLAQTGKPKK